SRLSPIRATEAVRDRRNGNRARTFLGKTAMSVLTLKVNGKSHSVDIDPATPLLYVLSDDLELRGPKFGCGLGQCGSCTVLVRGQAVRSCVTTTGSVVGADITT